MYRCMLPHCAKPGGLRDATNPLPFKHTAAAKPVWPPKK